MVRGATMLAAIVTLAGCYRGADDDAGGADGTASAEGGDGGDDGGEDLDADACEGLTPAATPLRRLTRVQYQNTIAALFRGAVAPSDAFPLTPHFEGFSTQPNATVVTQLAAEQILAAAEDVADQVLADLSAVLLCSEAGADDACVAAFIDEFGPRAFRRPLEPGERDLLTAIYEGGRDQEGLAQGVGRVLTVALQMPQFLYLVEEGTGEDTGVPGVIQLTDYELASRLSYLVWDSMPDEELFAAAAAGQLRGADALETHARRLLASDAAVPALARFYREWLHVRELAASDKDAALFPGFDDALAGAIGEEFQRLIEAVYRSDEPTLDALLTTNRTVVNDRLAALYGLPPVAEDWQRVDLDPAQRAGVLTTAAFLSSNASATGTTPVLRGKAVRTQLLCEVFPPPPADAMDRTPELPEDATEREKSEAILAIEDCYRCHVLMTPIGLGFENYDPTGTWRDAYPTGQTIDATGEIAAAPADLPSATFAGAVELAGLLAGSQTVAGCAVSNWFHHTHGKLAEGATEACAVESLTTRFAESGHDLGELVVAIVRSEGFRYRDLQEGE